MQILFVILILGTVLALQAFHQVEADKYALQCDVCRAVVKEANWKISQVDPKRFVRVGSFRVDPNGNQNIKEKKYARSESYVEDVFETICDMLNDYAELTNEDGTKEIVRSIAMDGTRLNTKDYILNRDIGKKLRYQCHDFLENHEEVVMQLLQREDLENYEQTICGEETEVCSDEQLSRPVTELPEAKPEEPEQNDAEDNEEVEEGEEGGEEAEQETSDFSDTSEKEEL